MWDVVRVDSRDTTSLYIVLAISSYLGSDNCVRLT